jgi:hypothetical protein
MDPFVVGTNAIFDVRAPSPAFKVDTRGWACPCGHRLRYARIQVGITVAFITNAFATDGMPQEPFVMFTSTTPIIGGAERGERLSKIRQGLTVYRDNPPGPGGAKYPLMSITRCVLSVT